MCMTYRCAHITAFRQKRGIFVDREGKALTFAFYSPIVRAR